MKSIIGSILLITVITSCEPNNQEKALIEANAKPYSYEHNSKDFWSQVEYKIEEKVIDSCEYIIILGMDGRNIIHKANCRNEFHLSLQGE